MGLSDILPGHNRVYLSAEQNNLESVGTRKKEGGNMAASYGGNVHGHDDCITAYANKGSLDGYRYYLAVRTVLEMLSDRGYDVPDAELSRSLAEFRSAFGDKPDVERLRFCFSLFSKPSKKMLVLFPGTDEIGVQRIRTIYGQICNRETLYGLILILQSKMTPFARKEVQKFPFKVEIFQITDLLVNITKHILQPKHEILTTEEKCKLLEKYKMKEEQLPRMLETDAIARYYGMEKGQVVKVTYSEGYVNSVETYRCVL